MSRERKKDCELLIFRGYRGIVRGKRPCERDVFPMGCDKRGTK